MTQQHPSEQGGVVMEIPGHHWQEQDRVSDYVARTTAQAEERRAVFNFMCDLFPFEPDAGIAVPDIGAGYGAVAAAVLDSIPKRDGDRSGHFRADDGSRPGADEGLW